MMRPDTGNAVLLFAFLLLVLAAGAPRIAHATGDNLVTILEPWARFTPMSGAVFGTLKLSGQVEDRVTGIDCPGIASHVEMHLTAMEDGVMKMKALDELSLTPGVDVRMEPGGLHVMLMSLQEKKKPGDTVTCTMHFEHAASLTFSAEVRPLGGGAHE